MHRSERRRLPGAGRSGDEHEATMLLGEPLDARRQPQRAEARNLARDHAHRERDLAALPEGVDAEPREARALVGEIELAGLLECREPRRGGSADFAQDCLELLGVERRPALEDLEMAVEADHRRLAGLEMDVARAAVDGVVQETVQLHASPNRQRTVGLERTLVQLNHPAEVARREQDARRRRIARRTRRERSGCLGTRRRRSG